MSTRRRGAIVYALDKALIGDVADDANPGAQFEICRRAIGRGIIDDDDLGRDGIQFAEQRIKAYCGVSNAVKNRDNNGYERGLVLREEHWPQLRLRDER